MGSIIRGQIRLAVACGLALLASLLVAVTAPSAEAQTSTTTPQQVVATSSSAFVTAVIGQDGEITTTWSGSAFGYDYFFTSNGPVVHDQHQWVALDLAMDGSEILLAAVSSDGRLFTRMGRLEVSEVTGDIFDRWGPLVQHGLDGWSTNAAPSLDMRVVRDPDNPQEATLEALVGGVKADGRMYTRSLKQVIDESLDQSWAGWTRHGLADWSRLDVALTAADAYIFGDPGPGQWLVAVKNDGRLYFRGPDETGWGAWETQGAATWNPDTEPAIVSDYRAVNFAAVKADGRLYTRQFDAVRDQWTPFRRHGALGWVAADIDTSNNVQHLAGVKADGQMYVRAFAEQAGELVSREWVRQGAGQWSASGPSVAAGREATAVLAAKDDGRRFRRYLDRWGMSAWTQLSGPA